MLHLHSSVSYDMCINCLTLGCLLVKSQELHKILHWNISLGTVSGWCLYHIDHSISGIASVKWNICYLPTPRRGCKGRIHYYQGNRAHSAPKPWITGVSSSNLFHLTEEETKGQRKQGIHQGHTGRQRQKGIKIWDCGSPVKLFPNIPRVRSMVITVPCGTWFGHCLLTIAPLTINTTEIQKWLEGMGSAFQALQFCSHLATHKSTAHYSDTE